MDKYDEAVAYLTAHPDMIGAAWGQDTSTTNEEQVYDDLVYPPRYSGKLFDVVNDGRSVKPGEGQDDLPVIEPDNEDLWWSRTHCGCLTQVAAGTHLAQTRELTIAIRADKRIPTDPEHITVADLPVFAEWQRIVDEKLGRGTDDHE